MKRLALLAFLLAACTPSDDAPTIATAASLRGVMPELAAAFGQPVTFTYGASGDLRKQVEGGAPIDAVVFASASPVDVLVTKGLAAAASRRVLATNRLVLIAPAGSAPRTFAQLASLPMGERVAIGDPGAVPAGQYAKDALSNLGIWGALDDRLVFGGDVAAVLAYARRGEVAAAIVYATEARNIDDVVVLDTAEGAWAPRAEVVAATTTASPRAEAFIDFVASPDGRRILEEHGFGRP